MNKIAIVAVVSGFIGCLGAQTNQTRTETTTTTTSSAVDLNGTLVDQGCYSTHSQKKESNSNGNSNTTTTTSTVTTECPVTTTSKSFGVLTSDGKFVRFDDSGNTRVIEMMKSNKDWHDYVENKKPVRVHVVGTENGDVVVVKEIK